MGWSRFMVVALLFSSLLLAGSLVFTFTGSSRAFIPDTDLSLADASFRGEYASDMSGYSVAPAGDVNGDGYDDFLIGATNNYDGEIISDGQTYLILGKETGWAMDTSLSEADASFWGEDYDNWAGSSVAPAGDVNGDGYDDFLIGAWGNSEGAYYAGQTYLILGKETGWAMDTSLSAVDASFWGEGDSDFSGCSVAPAGDVNGDGFDDFLIGAYGDDDGHIDAGQTYLILGKDSGWAMNTDLSAVDASFWGEDAGDASGSSVASAGDINGDGYDDFLIGARANDDGGSLSGQTYLILGKASGWVMDTSLSAADASFWGEGDSDFSGCSVAPAGDVNNDSYDDFLIGARGNAGNIGQTYLILGKASGWAMDTSLSAADASFQGEDADDRSGSSVAPAGDVNDDGYDDFLIGASGNDEGASGTGQTYLILGKASGWAVDTSLLAADTSFLGEDAGDMSGNSVAPAGDVNSDGYDDFLIGAYRNASNAGQTYLLLGYNTLPDAPASPLCEGETNPTGIGSDTPEFSWNFSDPDAGDAQSACQILVASSSENLADDIGDIWDSGKVTSFASTVSYAGSTLSPGDTYYWKVKTWDDHENQGPYCSKQTFTMTTLPDAPASPLCQGETNPTGVGSATPEFSWNFSDPDAGDTQSAWQILVASNSANLTAGNGDMWDSGKVTSSATTVPYAGSSLSWGGTYYWKVKTWDNLDYQGPYCSEQTFTMNALPNSPASPLCEGKHNPTGVGSAAPEFSWIFSDPDTGDTQYAYQILVASSSANLADDNGDMWDSGKVTSSASTISYDGPALSPGDIYYWKVKTWDNLDYQGSYCLEQTFTMITLPNSPASPLCEGKHNPTGVSSTVPEFSWTFSDPYAGDTQSAYQILVASSSANLAADDGDMWDSGKLISTDSTVSYDGQALSPGDTYYWKVKTWDNYDNMCSYCPEQTFIINEVSAGGGLSGGAIAGILIGSLAALLIIFFALRKWIFLRQ